jgi:phage terminase large subunit-like protein
MIERAKRDRAPYDRWAKDGTIEAVAGKRIGYSWVAQALGEICGRYGPRVIGADQYGLENLRDHLDEIGLALPIVVHPQGFRPRTVGENHLFKDAGAEDVTLWMPASIDRLEAAILEERLQQEDNLCQRMCMSGVVFEVNRTNHRMFAKDKATSRIDGAVSLAMAIGVATVGKKTTNVVDFATLVI